MERASDWACGGRALSSFSSMGNSSLVTVRQPVGPLDGIADLAHDVHQLVLAEGREVHLQAVVLEFQQCRCHAPGGRETCSGLNATSGT